MSRVTPKYIIGHWTGGNYTPCYLDMESYDLLITGDGAKIIGNYELDSNKASTAGMNSITYNISCCGGLTSTPLKIVQCEAFFNACAQKIKEFGLTVNDFYTHAEIGEMCKNGTICRLVKHNSYLNKNIGKVDLKQIPYNTEGKFTADFIRGKIQWYLERL